MAQTPNWSDLYQIFQTFLKLHRYLSNLYHSTNFVLIFRLVSTLPILDISSVYVLIFIMIFSHINRRYHGIQIPSRAVRMYLNIYFNIFQRQIAVRGQRCKGSVNYDRRKTFIFPQWLPPGQLQRPSSTSTLETSAPLESPVTPSSSKGSTTLPLQTTQVPDLIRITCNWFCPRGPPPQKKRERKNLRSSWQLADIQYSDATELTTDDLLSQGTRQFVWVRWAHGRISTWGLGLEW